jgi:hypothetical protein
VRRLKALRRQFFFSCYLGGIFFSIFIFVILGLARAEGGGARQAIFLKKDISIGLSRCLRS